jgi:hypothetical protein
MNWFIETCITIYQVRMKRFERHINWTQTHICLIIDDYQKYWPG